MIRIPEKDRFAKWFYLSNGKAFECKSVEINKEEHDDNSGWTIVKPKRSTKLAFQRKMKEKHRLRRAARKEALE